MYIDSTLYQKAFQRYLRYGISLEVQLKAATHETTHYTWHTQGDDKVRPEHAAREGMIFAWNDPVISPPGTEHGCRCTAIPYYGIIEPPIEPVFPELALLSVLPAGRLLSALRAFIRTSEYKPVLRQKYEQEVKSLSKLENNLKTQGKTTEEIARALSNARRQLGEKYKDLTPLNLRQKIYDRNLARYGDKLGPTPEYLRSQGKTWEDIIKSAKRPDGGDLF